MARKKAPLLNTAELIRIEQHAELDVIEERKRLAMQEANQHHMVRHDCLNRLVASADVTVQDLLEPDRDDQNHIALRDLTTVPREVARAVKKIKITNRTIGRGEDKETIQTVEVELAHHLSYDELIGKHVGLWSDNHHLHLHNHPPGEGTKLSELTPEQLAARRSQLEKEVHALDVRDTEPKGKS